jgi:hypothetical protein
MKELSWESWWSRDNVKAFFKRVPHELPSALAIDGYHLGQAAVWLLVAFPHQVYVWLSGATPTPTHGSDQQITLLDLHCILWILQTSLDKDDHLSAIEYLVTTVALPNFDPRVLPTLVAGYFCAFICCIKVTNHIPVVTQGLEHFATVSAMGLLHTFSHLSVMDPKSGVLADVRQHYTRVFPSSIYSRDFPLYHTLATIHSTFQPSRTFLQITNGLHPRQIQWGDYKPSGQEHIVFTHALTNLAQSEYGWREHQKKVPRWILCFALHSLSLDPLPPPSVIIGCLSIIAIDLGCDISGDKTMPLDERYVHT